ncbi:hypothetical protein G9A89_013992 [Geosiphon pyriformis]|nr:hypothetical protein G9A89_013992 [Geosiphon pyriformis]
MNINFKSLVVISKTLFLLGSHKKPMLMLSKKLLETSANAEEDNISFTTQFEMKFRTSILISKWHMELERKTQDSGEVVTEYAKAIRKLIKQVDSGRN